MSRTRSPLIALTHALALPCALATAAFAVDPWPGETWTTATDLTTSAGWTSTSTNVSGAYWNPVTRKLWLANNSGNFRRLKENGSGGFTLDTTITPSGALDLEGITQADPNADKVYLMVERANSIREYVASTGAFTRVWDLTSYAGGMPDANEGTEGIAFIPDSCLAKSGFRDSSGALYPQSIHGVNGLGGIMLISVQDGTRATAGYVYAVDLKNDGTWTRVGRYKTSRNESAELAFDATTCRLYILHNIDGNILEVTDLTSAAYNTDRKFTTLKEIQVPSSSNVEGLAFAPSLKTDRTKGDGWLFFTDDNNSQGAIRWFKQLPHTLASQAGDNQSATTGTTVAVAPSVLAKDAFGNVLPGLPVTFAVTAGSGLLTGANAVADSQGIAKVGSWKMGIAGANTLSATATGFTGSPVTFTATSIGPTAIQSPNATDRPNGPNGMKAPARLPSLQWLLGRVGLMDR